MNIALICPHPKTVPTMFERYVTPPLALQILAATTPKNHKVKIIDERFERLSSVKKFDVIGITPIAASVPHTYNIADLYRKQGAKVILGGYHASVLPNEAIKHADCVVIGEAEKIWPRILNDINNNSLKKFYKSNLPLNPNDIPPAKRNASKNKYIIAGIQATRGCPADCKFCMIRKNEGIRLRERPIKNVINEIIKIKNKRLVFYDASLTIDIKYSTELFKEMSKLNKKFICNGTINILSKNQKLLKYAAEAGCTAWFIGFESIFQNTLGDIGKTTNKIENYSKAIKLVRDHGMAIIGSFMFGFDNDTPDIFKKTLQVIDNWEIDSVEFSPLIPYPGTDLFEKLDKEGRILTKDWSKYDGRHIVFQPKNMTVEEYKNGIESLWNYMTLKKLLYKSKKTLDLGLSAFMGAAGWNLFTKTPYAAMRSLKKIFKISV